MTFQYPSLRKTTLITFVLFTLIIFLINVIPVAAKGADVTPPVIQSVDLSVTTAKPGDLVEVIVRATDSESGFPFVSTISSDSDCDLEGQAETSHPPSCRPSYHANYRPS